MSAKVPTLAASGVPCRRPVAVSKPPSRPIADRERERLAVRILAVGVNVYSRADMADVAGAPVIVGARLSRPVA